MDGWFIKINSMIIYILNIKQKLISEKKPEQIQFHPIILKIIMVTNLDCEDKLVSIVLHHSNYIVIYQKKKWLKIQIIEMHFNHSIIRIILIISLNLFSFLTGSIHFKNPTPFSFDWTYKKHLLLPFSKMIKLKNRIGYK